MDYVNQLVFTKQDGICSLGYLITDHPTNHKTADIKTAEIRSHRIYVSEQHNPGMDDVKLWSLRRQRPSYVH